MAWVRIDDHFPDHPKVVRAGPGASWLAVKALCWSSRYLTDGFIPERVAWSLSAEMIADQTREDSPRTFPETLVEAGIWRKAKGGFLIHDYLEYNPSREKVLAERQTTRERQERFRDRKTGHFGNGTSNAVSNAVTEPLLTRESRPPRTPSPTPKSNTPPPTPSGGNRERKPQWQAPSPNRTPETALGRGDGRHSLEYRNDEERDIGRKLVSAGMTESEIEKQILAHRNQPES